MGGKWQNGGGDLQSPCNFGSYLQNKLLPSADSMLILLFSCINTIRKRSHACCIHRESGEKTIKKEKKGEKTTLLSCSELACIIYGKKKKSITLGFDYFYTSCQIKDKHNT